MSVGGASKGDGESMTRKASGTTNPYREFEIHSGRRTVTTRYSSSAIQAAIDHLRAMGSSRDEIRAWDRTRSHGEERVSSLFPSSYLPTSPKTCGLGFSLRLAHVPSYWSAGSRSSPELASPSASSRFAYSPLRPS